MTGPGIIPGSIAMKLIAVLVCTLSPSLLTLAQLHPGKPAQYVRLPSLRESARIQDTWKNERLSRIPSLLKKYRIDAWLVSILILLDINVFVPNPESYNER